MNLPSVGTSSRRGSAAVKSCRVSKCAQNKGNLAMQSAVEAHGYSLGNYLASGSGGAVWSAVRAGTGEMFAVKRMVAKNPRRIQREWELMQFFNHPHIVHLHDVFAHEGTTHVVMEYMGGGNGAQWLQRQIPGNMAAMFPAFHQLVSAVSFLHACRVAHRDIKLDNMLFSRDFRTMCLTDFGLANILPNPTGYNDGDALNMQSFDATPSTALPAIARQQSNRRGSNSHTRGHPSQTPQSTPAKAGLMTTACGTPYFAAPEVVQGRSYDGQAADVWSIGVVLHCMYFGYSSNTAKRMSKKIATHDWVIPSSVDPKLRDLLTRMLTRDPQHRITLDGVRQHLWWIEMCETHGLNMCGSHGEAEGCELWRTDKATRGQFEATVVCFGEPFKASERWCLEAQVCEVGPGSRVDTQSVQMISDISSGSMNESPRPGRMVDFDALPTPHTPSTVGIEAFPIRTANAPTSPSIPSRKVKPKNCQVTQCWHEFWERTRSVTLPPIFKKKSQRQRQSSITAQ